MLHKSNMPYTLNLHNVTSQIYSIKKTERSGCQISFSVSSATALLYSLKQISFPLNPFSDNKREIKQLPSPLTPEGRTYERNNEDPLEILEFDLSSRHVSENEGSRRAHSPFLMHHETCSMTAEG